MNFTRFLKLSSLKMGESATGKTFPELFYSECMKRSNHAKLDNFPLTARLIIKLVRECEAREEEKVHSFQWTRKWIISLQDL